jgi:hypothetical protein
MQIKTTILNYIIHLKKIAKQSAGKPTKGELSVNSIKLYLIGVKSFLEFNEIALPWKKISKFYPDDVLTLTDLIQKKRLRNCYQFFEKEIAELVILVGRGNQH